MTGSAALTLRTTDPNTPNTPPNPTARQYQAMTPTVEARSSIPPAIAFTAHMPHYHPDYEDPIDGRYPLHFDPSVEFSSYRNTVDQNDGRKLGTLHIEQKVYDMLARVTPPIETADVVLTTCITSVSRATAPPDTDPDISPPLFGVYIHKRESHRWAEIYDDLKDLLEAEFPIGVYPNCYPRGQMIIRFFHKGDDMGFASSSAR